jgi:hypothetical protein
MVQGDSVDDVVDTGPAQTVEVEEIMDADDVESVESVSQASRPVLDRSESHETRGNEPHNRFNLRARKLKNSDEMELDPSTPDSIEDQEPRTLYLGIHGWMQLKEGSALTLGPFREAPSFSGKDDFESTNNGTEEGMDTWPTFKGQLALISNSSKSDDSGGMKAAKKAALRDVVVRSLPMKTKKNAKAKDKSNPSNREKATKRLKKPIKSGLSKTEAKKKIKLSKRVTVRSPSKNAAKKYYEPAPFKPVEREPTKGRSLNKSSPPNSGGSRISSYKSSRSVAMELQKQKANGGKPGDFNITNITFDDVLLGRGNNLVTYEGNIRYRKVILMYRDRYIAAGRIEKGQIAKKVIETVWSRGGRFLESKNNDQRIWREAELPRLLEKATQALREKHAWKEHPEDRCGRVRH